MTAFTQTQTGNWNDAATWGGGGYPQTSGDTATLLASADCTIPAGVSITCGAISTQDGSSGDYTRLVINGTLDLAGAVTLGAFAEIAMGAGSTLDLNGYNITNTGRTKFTFTGTANSRVTVMSTGSAGRFLGGDSFQTLSDWQYVDVSGLGDSTIGNNHVIAASHQSFQYCTFTNCAALAIDPNSTRTDQGFLLSHCDFRNPSSADPETAGDYQPDMWTGEAGAGTRIIEYCTWETSGSVNGVIKLRSPGMIFRYNVVSNYKLYSYHDDLQIEDCFFNNTKNADEEFLRSSGGNNLFASIADSYWYYSAGGHPMGYLTQSIDVEDSVFEMSGSHNGADWFLYNTISAKTIRMKRNVWIGTAGSPVTITNTASPTLLDISRNTMYIDNLGTTSGTPSQYFPLLLLTEQSGVLSGTVEIYNNLVIDPDSSTARDAAVDLVSATANQLDYCNYNVGWGFPLGSSSPPVLYRANGSDLAGFGANDFAADPLFVERTRTIATWDTSNGGAGTVANAITELLKLNGTGGTWDSDYSVSNLVSWVRAGFVPQAAGLNGTGRNGDDIGALDVVLPAAAMHRTWISQSRSRIWTVTNEA